ncbi:hypothetical protein Pmar_PMAR003703 [Perkinsus marinus ATCC 50983]|uniref:Uncharacterized protein n=1 Tax=Perkinsus marinus (strain ATCC 50983 / TXsc) TaxID=423536 RepID=C5KI28_PERM5|nr:hypothetical protein Pmar_PMAR003703 [Perkinsus marinus ATCC 50983]EER16240.1 hypothetical protein Pmar_PMAR003703 [Perkinsus marinus ATCC 50983]|eukprot:XP_002784444.1 hypothetical protein Pmar_PMAR003703 [Perkinsus marinus ATCC 50983]
MSRELKVCGDPEVELYNDVATLAKDVKAMLPLWRDLMIAVHPAAGYSYPTLSWLTEQFRGATRGLFVVNPVKSIEDTVTVTAAVFVMNTAETAREVHQWFNDDVKGERSVIVSSFPASSTKPLSPVTDRRSRHTVSLPRVESFSPSCDSITTADTHDSDYAPLEQLVQIDKVFPLQNGRTGVCGSMTLTDVKSLLPQDEEDCRGRVLLVKRCHKLGLSSSVLLKDYFDKLVDKKDAVTMVLMLPLKSRYNARSSRPLPPKTGFVVFSDPADALIARAYGSLQHVLRDVEIKVETYDRV